MYVCRKSFLIISNHCRAILMTASEDNAIRVWGHPNRLKRENGWYNVDVLALIIPLKRPLDPCRIHFKQHRQRGHSWEDVY